MRSGEGGWVSHSLGLFRRQAVSLISLTLKTEMWEPFKHSLFRGKKVARGVELGVLPAPVIPYVMERMPGSAFLCASAFPSVK